MSVVTADELKVRDKLTAQSDDGPIIKVVESLLGHIEKAWQQLADRNCSLIVARALIGSKVREAKELIEFITDSAKRSELLERLPSMQAA